MEEILDKVLDEIKEHYDRYGEAPPGIAMSRDTAFYLDKGLANPPLRAKGSILKLFGVDVYFNDQITTILVLQKRF